MVNVARICMFVMVAMIAACGGNQHGINHTEVIDNIARLPLREAGIFVFRDTQPGDNAAINVYIDGDYLASLQKKSYRYVDLCPGKHHWESVSHDHDPAYYNKLSKNHIFDLAPGEVRYFKVAGSDRYQARLVETNAQEAERLLPELHLQDHTISRVVSGYNCK